MKAKIAEIEQEVAERDGSQAYRDCLYHKYRWERKVSYEKERLGGVYYYKRYDRSLGSGLAAGTIAFTPEWADLHEPYNSQLEAGKFWLEGRDKDLLSVKYTGVVSPVRPLSAGEYKFYYNDRPYKYIICDAIPDAERKRIEVFVTVTAPDGALHEAFFDPVAINDDIGADASNGVLKPASYTSVGTTITINGIEWGSQQVSLEATSSLPADHHVEFLALDASVALRLDVDDATATTSGGVTTHNWHVCNQPWSAGDKLMLRISSSSSDLTGVTNDEPCAAPTPESTA